MPVADLVAEAAASPLLQAALAGDGVFGSFLGPWSAGSGLLFLLAAANEAAGGAETVFVRGGPGALATAIAAAATAAGVRIRTGEAVTAIVTDEGGARGVRLAGNGGTLDASLVVSGLDPKRTLLGLCDPLALSPEFQWRLRNVRTRGVLAKVNLALAALPVVPGADRDVLTGRIRIAPGRGVHRARVRPREIRALVAGAVARGHDPDAARSRRWRRPAPTCCRCMRSSRRTSCARPTRPVGRGAPISAATRWAAPGVREALGETVLAALDRAMPGIRSLIVAGEVITPLDLERDLGLHRR